MELLDFLNNHKQNWQQLLTAEPYYLEFHFDAEYVLFKYNQYMSNMALPLVQEARGSIFTFNTETQMWECVCHAMNKFFNWGEPNAAAIEWQNAKVLQKVDGSIIKFWFHNRWHISTNNTIDAFKCQCGETNFGALVKQAMQFQLNDLDPNYCYWFELTTPYNALVVHYEGWKLWYLGCRNMKTDEEEERKFLNYVPTPKSYAFHSLPDVLAAAKVLQNAEGYVVMDKNWNRIKIKGEEYLRLAKLRGNDTCPTTKRLIELWQSDQLDDYMANFTQFHNECQNFCAKLQEVCAQMLNVWQTVANIMEVKTMVQALRENQVPSFIFHYCMQCRRKEWLAPNQYLHKLTNAALLRIFQ